MSLVDFELKRTLTDVLEDELYHINIPNTIATPTTTNSNSTTIHPKDNVDTNMLSLDSNSNDSHNNSYPLDNDTFHPSQNSNVYSSNNQNYANSSIFSSYADPTLTTTTTMRNYTIASELGAMIPASPISSLESNSSIQKTVNLNTLVRNSHEYRPTVSNIFYNNSSSNNDDNNNNNNNNNNNIMLNGMNTLYDVKISPENSLYTPILDDNEYMSYYDDFYSAKLDSMPLDNSNSVLNMDSARMIFDQEFSDDDLEEDEDEDDNVFDMAPSSAFSMTSDYPTYYPNDVPLLTTNELDTSALIDDQDDRKDRYSDIDMDMDASNHFRGGDDIERMVEPLVFNSKLLASNRSKSSLLKHRPELMLPNGSGKHLDTIVRRPLGFVDGNNNSKSNIKSNDDSNASSHKKKTDNEKKKRARSARLPSNINHGSNEIYTCRLVNLVTNEPCMAQFSRSYDLTRHQNTIHAKKKIVFRCSECIRVLGDEGYSKTFSRLDALTRHIKLKHEELTPEQRQVVTKYAKENIGYVV